MDPLTSILRNWSLLGSAHVISSLIAMAVMVFVSRTLGDVEFGRLHLALTLTTIVGVVVDFGLTPVVTRVVARDHALARPYLLRAALVVGALGSCLYLVLLGSVAALGLTEVRSLVAILGVLIVVEGFSMLLSALFQAHEQMVAPAIARVAGNALTFAIVVPLLWRGYGIEMVATVVVLGALLRVAIQAAAVGRLGGFKLAASPSPSLRQVLGAGLPFLAAQGLGMFVVRIDVVILALLTSVAAVGWYGAAFRLVEALNFIPLVLTMVTFPVLSRLWVDARPDFHATVLKMLRIILVIAVPLSMMLLVLAEDVVDLLFTLRGYARVVPILRIEAVSLAFVFVDYFLVCTLMAIGRERIWIAIVAASCVLNPALNFVLIPATDALYANGAIGAALATLLTEIFFLVSTLRALPAGVIGVDSARVAIRAVALGGVLGALLVGSRAVGVPWVLAAAVWGCAYVAAVFQFGLVPPDVIAWARGMILRRRQPIAAVVRSDAA
jgi:O-antigen/teichoic acid export membrane protein